ncbi:MAG: alpha/beta hydrolase [Devosia sp.]
MATPPPKFLTIDAETAIHVIHARPRDESATFVFLNSMGATTKAWESEIGPALRAKGFGTLSFDYRGQGETVFGPSAVLEPEEIIDDIVHVMQAEAPSRPIMVGLSIGGLFAAHALRKGAHANGLALINTLRKQNAQVEWINTLEARLIAMGGMPLVLDVLRPVLSGRDQLEVLRPTHLLEEGYTPWPADNPRRRLAEGVHKADWTFPWQTLTVPALVFTGQHDRLFRIQEDVDELVAQIPDATMVTYADGGHSLHAEHPERFVDDLTAFADTIAQKDAA